jgi:glutathione S-transferase
MFIAMSLKLYHSTTSVCAMKVRLTLEEKGLAWESELLNLQRGDQHQVAYLKLNANAVVPTLVHDGRVLIESTLIIEYLDEAFPAASLMPADPHSRAQARLFMKKIDDYLHAATSTITFAAAFRAHFLKLSPDELRSRLERIPDPAYRERQRLSIEQGLDAPHVAPALRQFDRYFDEMEKALGDSAYLAGDSYSLADAAATPYVNRAGMLGMQALWSERPRLQAWLGRITQRPNFARAVSSWFTDADRERFTVNREAVNRALARID